MPLDMEVGLGPGDFVLDGEQTPRDQKRGTVPNFRPHMCCGQTAGWIKMPLDTDVGLGQVALCRRGTQIPSKKGRDTAPNFWPMSVVAKWLYLPLDMELGLSPGDFVLDGHPVTPPKKGAHSPQFSAHVSCGQTARWIKMPLDREVGLGPSDTVLDGDTTPPQKRAQPPTQFLACLLLPNDYASGYHLVQR